MRKFDHRGQGKFTTPEFRKLPFFGGNHCTKRRFRVRRPLSTEAPIHLVLRSSQAVGQNSFLRPKNRKAICALLLRLGQKWGIEVQNFANVGNHLHLQIRIRNLRTYKPFICALTGGIATMVTGGSQLARKFWDYRPFSRIVHGLKGYLRLRDYLLINQYEGGGVHRSQAICLVKGARVFESG